MRPAAKDRLVRALGPPALVGLFHSLAASYRYAVVQPERLEALRSGGPAVVVFWHDQAFAAARFLHRDLHRAGCELTVIASQSREGELVARLAAHLGVPVVRGSSSRGGRGAILALYRAIAKHASSALILPDGPRGPRHVAKPGAVLLAQFAQVPIVPLAFAADRGVGLRSWDRMEVPRPAARVVVTIGEPRRVARHLAPAELEEERAGMEAALEALAREAREVAREAREITREPRGLGEEARATAGETRELAVEPRDLAGLTPHGAGGTSAAAGVRAPEVMHEKKPV
jgi:lysophospholipid acyltransferase (LPLAT)-like uncharacterized protein